MQDYFGYEKGKELVHTCPKDLYHKYYFKAFNTVINCIDDRFDQENLKMYVLLEQVLLKAAKHARYKEELKEVIQFYKEDFDESLVRSHLLTFSINFQSTTEKDVNITWQKYQIAKAVTLKGHRKKKLEKSVGVINLKGNDFVYDG